MRALPWLGRLAVAVAVACACGCSFIDVRGPSSHLPPHGDVKCTRDNVLPIIDTVFAGGEFGIVGLLIYEGLTDHTSDTGGMVAIAAVPVVVLGTVTALSANYGYNAVARCHRAMAEHG